MKAPLSTAATLILAALADGDRHGYAVRKEITRRTGDEVRLGVTTLYRLLNDLEAAGLIDEPHVRPAPELDDERRRYFRITPAGRRALAAEIKRLERVLTAVRSASLARLR
jgi:DNA-binding PadR family transcriptional regulator